MEIQNSAAKGMDRMSGLPDEILLHILSFLPTKNAVSTSILSSRYSNLWIELPVVDLVENNDHYCVKSDKNKFAFMNFLNNLLLVNTYSTIRKFRLKQNFDFDERYLFRINGWIRFVLSRNVVELDLETRLDNEDDFCLRLWPCDSLEILKLSTNTGLLIPLISCDCFKNLRIFHFSFDENPSCRELVAKLFPNLPLLEELVIRVETYGKICFNIVAPALKTFSINRVDMATDLDNMEVKVVIDAPLLEHIRVEDDDVSFYSLNNCPLISEAKVNVGGMMDADNFLEEDRDPSTYISNLVKLLSGIANTKSLSLSGVTVLALAFSQSNLPIFPRLTKLDLSIPYAPECKLLLPWLVNAPKLEVLTVAMREFKETDEDIYYASQESDLIKLIGALQLCPPEVVPNCLLLHLKEIEARGFKKKPEMSILAYIIRNAKVLKKLTLNGVRRI